MTDLPPLPLAAQQMSQLLQSLLHSNVRIGKETKIGIDGTHDIAQGNERRNWHQDYLVQCFLLHYNKIQSTGNFHQVLNNPTIRGM